MRRLSSQSWIIIALTVTLLLSVSALTWTAVTAGHESQRERQATVQAHKDTVDAIRSNNQRSCQAFAALASLPTKYPATTATDSPTRRAVIRTVELIPQRFAVLYRDYGCQPPLRR